MNSLTSDFLKDPDNLDHLRLIDKAAVKRFVDDLNACTPDALNGKKPVAVIATGGTISMKIENGIRVPNLDFDAIFRQADAPVSRQFQVVGLNAFRLDSSQMDYSHVREIIIVMTYVWKHARVPFAGFMILHGTDSMAYAAAATSLMMGQGLPFSVVYTGSQKPAQEPRSDAATNLSHALLTLEALHVKDMAEVVIAMGDYAILGTSAVKVDSKAANAFGAPLHQCVMYFTDPDQPGQLAPWLDARRADVPFQPAVWADDFSRTLVVHSTLGLDPAVVERQAMDPDIRAVLLFSYGAGTVYEGVTDALMRASAARDIPVFAVSPLNDQYEVAYESARNLIARGVTPLYMTLPAALAKVEIALRRHPGDRDATSRFMAAGYVGEVPSDASRLSPGAA